MNRGVGEGLPHDTQEVLGDLSGQVDSFSQLETHGESETGGQVLGRLRDGARQRLRLGTGEDGDRPPCLVQGPIGGPGELPDVDRHRTVPVQPRVLLAMNANSCAKPS